jgi:hypothetical protein
MSTQIIYDTKSGRIVGIHHGQIDPEYALQRLEYYAKIEHFANIGKGQIAVMTVPSTAFERGKQYKVDVRRKALVETSVGKGGVGFGFDSTSRTS